MPGYGSAQNPISRDPWEYIVGVHWGDLVGFEIQFLLDMPVPPGVLTPTEPRFTLNTSVDFDSGLLPIATAPPIQIPTFGSWAVTLQLDANAPTAGIATHAFVNLFGVVEVGLGDVYLTTPEVDQTDSALFAGLSATASGAVPILGPAAFFPVTVKIFGVAGGGIDPGHGADPTFTGGGNVGGGSSITILWQSE